MDRQKLLEKLVRLEKQKADVTAMKKSMAKDYRDQLKDINSEIDEVMDALDPAATPDLDAEPVDFE